MKSTPREYVIKVHEDGAVQLGNVRFGGQPVAESLREVTEYVQGLDRHWQARDEEQAG